MDFAIRLDETKTATRGSISLFLSRQASSVKRAICFEEGDGRTLKKHYHIFISYKEKKKPDTIRKMVARAFENRGSTKSTALCRNSEQYLTYISKDNNVVYKNNFTDEEIGDYLLRSYKPKGDKVSMMTHLINEVDRIHGVGRLRVVKDITEESLVSIVYNYYRKKRKPMNFHYMKSLVRGLKAQYLNESNYDDFFQFCIQN